MGFVLGGGSFQQNDRICAVESTVQVPDIVQVHPGSNTPGFSVCLGYWKDIL